MPELDALFDVGLAPRSMGAAANLFLSHGHVDHMGALPTLLGLRALMGARRPLRVFAPKPVAALLPEALEALSRLQGWPLEIDPVGLEPGDEVPLRADLHVRALRTMHTVPSLGYLLFRRVTKLREAFIGLPAAEIGRRRKAGDPALFYTLERPLLAYLTDTLPEALDENPGLLEVPTLVLECTFLDERKSVVASRAGCHVHLDELLRWAPAFANERLILMHFSQLYGPGGVREILARRWPADARVQPTPFLPEGDRWPG